MEVKGLWSGRQAAGNGWLSSQIPQALANSAFTAFRIGGRRKASGSPPFLPGGGNLVSIATQKQSWPCFAYDFSVTFSWSTIMTSFSDLHLLICGGGPMERLVEGMPPGWSYFARKGQ